MALNLWAHEPNQDPQASPGLVCVSLADPRLSWGSVSWEEENCIPQVFLIPGLCPPHPVTLTMQLYSSSSISFTFRQYDCGTGEARLSEWLHLLDGHPDVPSLPHATLPLGHPGERPCQASWALQTSGWDELRHVRERLAAVLRNTQGETTSFGVAQGGAAADGRGPSSGRVEWPERQPAIYQTQVPRDALENRVPWSKGLGKSLVDSRCTWANQRL